MLHFLRAAVVAACLVPLALPAAAHAQLDLSVAGVTASETVGNGDDVVGPGDQIRVDTTIGTATALNGAAGTLYTATPSVTPVALMERVNRSSDPHGTLAATVASNGRVFFDCPPAGASG